MPKLVRIQSTIEGDGFDAHIKYSLSDIWREIGLSPISNMLAWQKDRIVDLKTKNT